MHGSYHDNLNTGLDRYGSLKRGKLTPTMLEDTADSYIMPTSTRMLSGSLSHGLQQHTNEIAALRQLQIQQQMQYEHTIEETELV